MPLKKPVKKAKVKLPFKQIDFQLEAYPGCCGINCVSDLRYYEGRFDYYKDKYNDDGDTFATEEESFEDLYRRILKVRTDQDGWGDYPVNQFLIALKIENGPENGGHGDAELQAKLHVFFRAKKWPEYSRFINPGSSNTLVLLGKKFRDKALPEFE